MTFFQVLSKNLTLAKGWLYGGYTVSILQPTSPLPGAAYKHVSTLYYERSQPGN